MNPKRILVFSLYILVTAIAPAQTQQGYVKTKGRLNANGTVTSGQRLTGATIAIQNGNSVVSDTNGTFTLRLSSNKFVLKSVTKNNFVIADPDFLKKQYDCSANDFVIVMEDELEKANERRQIEKKVRNNLNAQAEKQRDEINRLRQENKITEEKYRELQQKVNNDEDENEAIIKDMVEKYSKIDFDQEDDFDRQFSAFLLNGETLRADSLLRTKGNILKELNDFKAFQTANAQKRAEQAVRDSLENCSKMELADRCYKYSELFKMQHRRDSAYNYLHLRASLDTTNVQWVSELGNYVMKYMADYDLAKKYFDQALSLSLSMYGRINIRTAQSYFNLGELMIEMSKTEEAVANYQQARDIFENVEGKQATDVAGCLNGTGVAHILLGDYTKGIDFLNHALDMLLKDKGEINKEVAETYGNLGIGYSRLKNLEKAMECQQKALHIKQQITTVPKSSIAVDYNNIAMIYNDKKEYDQAMEYFQKSLELYQSEYGEYHPSIAICYGNIGMVYFDKKDFQNALIYYQKELDMCKSIIGDEHPNIAKCYNNIASVYENVKDYQKALDYYQLSLSIISKTFNEGHPIIKMLHGSINRIETKIKDMDLNAPNK